MSRLTSRSSTHVWTLAGIAGAAAVAAALTKTRGAPYEWVATLVGGEDPRWVFVVFFIGVLAPFIAIKTVLSTQRT